MSYKIDIPQIRLFGHECDMATNFDNCEDQGSISPSFYILKFGENLKFHETSEDDIGTLGACGSKIEAQQNDSIFYEENIPSANTNISFIQFSDKIMSSSLSSQEIIRKAVIDSNGVRQKIKNGVNDFNDHDLKHKELLMAPQRPSQQMQLPSNQESKTTLRILFDFNVEFQHPKLEQYQNDQQSCTRKCSDKKQSTKLFKRFRLHLENKSKRNDVYFKCIMRGFRKTYMKNFNSFTSFQKYKRNYKNSALVEFFNQKIALFSNHLLEEAELPSYTNTAFNEQLKFTLSAILYHGYAQKLHKKDAEKTQKIFNYRRLLSQYSNSILARLLEDECFMFLFQQFLIKDRQYFMNKLQHPSEQEVEDYQLAFEFLENLAFASKI